MIGITRNELDKTLKDELDNYKNKMSLLEEGDNLKELTSKVNNIETALKDSTLTPFTTSDVITPLTNCFGGFVNIDSIQGKTRYKKSDGTFTDVWESGVSLESVGETVAVGSNFINYTNQNLNKSLLASNGTLTDNPGNNTTDFINVTANKSYIIENYTYISASGGVCLYDSSKNFIKGFIRTTVGDGKLIFEAPQNCAFARIPYIIGNEVNLSIKESSYKIEILSKKSDGTIGDKTEILTTQPLRQWDSIDSNGVITRGSGQAVLNGGEDWALTISNTNTIRFSYIQNNRKTGSTVFSDKFKTLNTTIDNEFIIGGEYISISILKSRLTTQDVVGFKTWLSQNSTTVVYQLAIPTTENTNKTLVLSGYQNGSLIVNSGSVNPTVTGTYATNLGGRVASMEGEIINVKNTVKDLNYYEEVLLTPLNGFINSSTILVCKAVKHGNIVSLMVYLDSSNATYPFDISTNVLKLPSNFYPKYTIVSLLASYGGNVYTVVDSIGNVSFGQASNTSKPLNISGTITYVI